MPTNCTVRDAVARFGKEILCVGFTQNLSRDLG